MKNVRVYRNLHKQCLSVLHRTEKGWRLWKHLEQIELMNVKFKVSQAGRERVLKEKRKNVHAFVEGEYSDIASVTPPNIRFVKYNPYIAGHFIDQESGEKISESTWVLVTKKGIMAI
jgi:hypothetical protein